MASAELAMIDSASGQLRDGTTIRAGLPSALYCTAKDRRRSSFRYVYPGIAHFRSAASWKIRAIPLEPRWSLLRCSSDGSWLQSPVATWTTGCGDVAAIVAKNRGTARKRFMLASEVRQ